MLDLATMPAMTTLFPIDVLGDFIGTWKWYTPMGLLLVVLIVVYVQMKKRGA